MIVAGSAAALRTSESKHGVSAEVWAECGFHDGEDEDDDGDGASVVLVVRQRGLLNALVNLPASSSAVACVTWTCSAQNTRTHLISACFLCIGRVYCGLR